MNILLVMIGGFFGSISRYMVGEWLHTNNGFPLGTLTVNLAGCFLLAWFLTFMTKKALIPAQVSLLIGTGFTGSFTTFSTFSVDTIQLIQDNDLFMAVSYVFLNVVGGLLLSFAGYQLAYQKTVESRGR